MNVRQMTLADALGVLREARGPEDVVVTSMGSAREWLRFDPHPLDFAYVPSSMGQGTSIALGIALARPDRRVIVANGDGSMLMNLGSLVTITAQAPPNLVVLVFDNGVYEVTGGQPTPGAADARQDRRDVDFCTIARGCGFESVFAFEELEAWQRDVRTVLQSPGPVFVRLRVEAEPEAGTPRPPSPGAERARAFREALGAS